jgi:hypothetical protein
MQPFGCYPSPVPNRPTREGTHGTGWNDSRYGEMYKNVFINIFMYTWIYICINMYMNIYVCVINCHCLVSDVYLYKLKYSYICPVPNRPTREGTHGTRWNHSRYGMYEDMYMNIFMYIWIYICINMYMNICMRLLLGEWCLCIHIRIFI